MEATSAEGGCCALLSLQSRMKCDPAGYEEELLLQLRHFEACLRVFHLHSSSKSLSSSFANDQSAAKELADMAMFLAHVTPFYRQHLRQFPQQILNLLQISGDSLQPALRRQLTQALILLRNRQMIELIEILPVLMELQTLGDRALRKLASLHIIQDVRRMNLKHRNESKNRPLQNVLFKLLQDDNECRSRRSLFVLCELHRRKLWDDDRTGNAICAACFHPSSKILKDTLAFLLGYEKLDEEDMDSAEEEGEEHKPIVALSREAVYKANHKGTLASRRKKQAKLQRVMRSLKKQQKNQAGEALGSSPLHDLHDSQSFAEKLFSKLQTSNERFEVKLMMMKVISRAIGLHRLVLLNFYPFLQKYVQPYQHEITHVLAAAVQACHDLVPPDAVESLLRQVVNQFVHDRARPEVIAVGLNVVREMCMRMPLIMTRELLTDLALYKKSREKAVSSASRSIISVFRQVYPSLLEKRDRGKGADLLSKPKAFGENVVDSNVPGIDLLVCDDNKQSDNSQSDEHLPISDSDGESDDSEANINEQAFASDAKEVCADDGESEDPEANINELAFPSDDEEMGEDDGVESSYDSDYTHGSSSESEEDDEVANASAKAQDAESEPFSEVDKGKDLKRKRLEEETQRMLKQRISEVQGGEPSDFSLRGLKKLLVNQNHDKSNLMQKIWQGDDGILSDSDFRRIRKLQAKKVARDALANAGIGKFKRKDEPFKNFSSEFIHERRVNPAMLEVKIHRRQEKEERLASVRAGQEERQTYKARTSVKQNKSGGLSNRQKEKKKLMPLAAKLAKASRSRMQKNANRRSTKQFRGKKAWKN